MKTFISQNINKIKLAPFPESIVLVATCTYHEGNDEFHAILQLAKPTDLDSSGNYNTLTAVAAPYNVNVIEEIQRSWGIFGYPIAFNITEFPDSEFRNFLFTGDSVIQELDTPVDLFNGLSGNPKNSSLAAFASFTFMQGNKYSEECVIMPADWDQWIGESDLMIRAGSSLEGMTMEQVLYKDYKTYTINNAKIGLGQVITTDIKDVLDKKDEYIELLNKVCEHNDYLYVCLFVTDILKNGTYVLYSDRAKEPLQNGFNIDNIKQGIFLRNVVSRKKQILPVLMGDNE